MKFFMLSLLSLSSISVLAATEQTITIKIYDKGFSKKEARILPDYLQIFPTNESVSDYLETLEEGKLYTCTAALSSFTKDAENAILYRIKNCK